MYPVTVKTHLITIVTSVTSSGKEQYLNHYNNSSFGTKSTPSRRHEENLIFLTLRVSLFLAQRGGLKVEEGELLLSVIE